MLAALRSSWSTTGLAQTMAVVCIASTSVQAILVGEVFTVESGTTKGGCDNHDVDQWFQDSLKLADAAMSCIDDAIAQKTSGTTNADSQKYLQTFFNINAKLGNFGGYAQKLKDSVQVVIDALNDATTDPDKPWIFCDSTWAEEKIWNTLALDEGTGFPNANGDTIAGVYPDLYTDNYVDRLQAIANAPNQAARDALPPPMVPYWADTAGLKKYNYDITGDYCSRGLNLAGTDDNFQPNTITLCAKNWAGKGWHAKLDDIPLVTAEKISVEDLQAECVTLFHEVFHFALENANTPDTAYQLTEITRKKATTLTKRKITIAQSMSNPETFALFALSYELGRRNPAYTFASSASKRL